MDAGHGFRSARAPARHIVELAVLLISNDIGADLDAQSWHAMDWIEPEPLWLSSPKFFATDEQWYVIESLVRPQPSRERPPRPSGRARSHKNLQLDLQIRKPRTKPLPSKIEH